MVGQHEEVKTFITNTPEEVRLLYKLTLKCLVHLSSICYKLPFDVLVRWDFEEASDRYGFLAPYPLRYPSPNRSLIQQMQGVALAWNNSNKVVVATPGWQMFIPTAQDLPVLKAISNCIGTAWMISTLASSSNRRSNTTCKIFCSTRFRIVAWVNTIRYSHWVNCRAHQTIQHCHRTTVTSLLLLCPYVFCCFNALNKNAAISSNRCGEHCFKYTKKKSNQIRQRNNSYIVPDPCVCATNNLM